ncbi:MAG: hypothetical protein QNJ47_16145 [Nostocaceae cyanobacterium]|nr:hypothetical protein [Nostocaceae cyanobacterium]
MNKVSFVRFVQEDGSIWRLNLNCMERVVFCETDSIPYLTVYFVSDKPPLTFTGKSAISAYQALIVATS